MVEKRCPYIVAEGIGVEICRNEKGGHRVSVFSGVCLRCSCISADKLLVGSWKVAVAYNFVVPTCFHWY